ncbi:DUF4238 domain-containing protein [Amorphus orientalis]|uniref:DUF4238 domain-containing protein n=1 Tax=Amorphus orientalis TaxID=649198 RepID=A0AAE3VLA5_9HYPH|nr:DUF4238 domain-containing protein [Amorphus orientalis]MDQ0314604.1 hypothetical protein [Amorphus orientalis]
MSTPRDHHYIPQFYLRNFAVDPDKKKVNTVAKNGAMAVWAKRSIESLGFERDLYVSLSKGVPISVETEINKRIETPISQSDTWTKITSGRTDTLDKADKPIIYALIRHLEARTPKYKQTISELSQMAVNKGNEIAFTDEERKHYAYLNANPNELKTLHNLMSLFVGWEKEEYIRSSLTICRSPIPIRTLSAPVMAISAPPHPALDLPLPGMVPFQLILALDPKTVAILVRGDFGDSFMNIEIDEMTARGLNRNFVGHFSHFNSINHLISDRNGLIEDMTWAPYDLIEESERRIKFRRREA